MSDWIRKRFGDKASTEPVQVERTRSFSGSLQEMLIWCSEVDVTPEQVTFTGQSHLAYPSVETAGEVAARLDAIAREVQRHEQWERDMYDRLRAKFDPSPASTEENR